MIASKVAIDEARYYLSRSAKTIESLSEKLSTGKRIKSAADSSHEWLQMRNSYRKFSTLQSINISLNELANDIRVVDMSMDTIDGYIMQMKGDLTTIVETHPPFDMGSKERAVMIENFNTFRQQINQMTEPSGNLGARMIMADPNSVPEAGDLTVVVSDDGIYKTIRSQEVHTGPNGLDIPELLADATQQDIRDALANLQVAKDKLNKKRTVLSLEALNIDRSIEFNEKAGKMYLLQAEELETTNDMEVAVELQSMELQHMLTIEVIGSLLENQYQLLALLE